MEGRRTGTYQGRRRQRVGRNWSQESPQQVCWACWFHHLASIWIQLISLPYLNPSGLPIPLLPFSPNPDEICLWLPPAACGWRKAPDHEDCSTSTAWVSTAGGLVPPSRWTLLLPEEVISHLLFFPKFPAPPHWSSLSGGDDLHSNWGNRHVHKGTSSTFPVKSTNALAFGLAHFAFSAATNERQSVLPSHLHPSLSCIFGFLPSLDQSHYIHICWYLFFKCLIVMKYT